MKYLKSKTLFDGVLVSLCGNKLVRTRKSGGKILGV